MQEDDLSYADTDTLLSSRRETNDDFEDTESSITSVSQAAGTDERLLDPYRGSWMHGLDLHPEAALLHVLAGFLFV